MNGCCKMGFVSLGKWQQYVHAPTATLKIGQRWRLLGEYARFCEMHVKAKGAPQRWHPPDEDAEPPRPNRFFIQATNCARRA